MRVLPFQRVTLRSIARTAGAIAIGCSIVATPISFARADSNVVAIGAPLPLSGPLAPFGATIQAGYERAIADANTSGGVMVGAERRKFQLVVRDSQSQPNLAAGQARSLVDENGVAALLGSVSPPLTIPVSTVAESKHVPMVTTLTPVGAWAAANPSGWKYSWDIFFAEDQMTDLQYQTANLLKTNKRVALFTDNEQDGAVMGELWKAKAAKFGYTIASHATFPVGTNDFGSFIAEAKKAGATVVIAQMIPPDAFALWKQMKSLGYAPAVAFCEKCGAVGGWPHELGPVGNGTMNASFWSPALGRPQTQEFLNSYRAKFGTTPDLNTVVASYTAAKVLLDAIASSHSTDADKIDDALAKTNSNLVLGRIRFNDKHQAVTNAVMLQWQGANSNLVYPRLKTAAAVVPLGLVQ